MGHGVNAVVLWVPFFRLYGVEIGLGFMKRCWAYPSHKSTAWLREVPFEGRENSELPRREDDVMLEGRVGPVGELG